MKKAALHNLGCKVNAYETEAMQQRLADSGYEIVPFTEKADVYIINTCTVTNMADRKSRQMLHRAKKLNPEAVVVAAGCYVQASRAACEADDAIDIVIGNNKKKDIVEILREYEAEKGEQETVIDISHTKEYEDMPVSRMENHTRAYIKVQDGCNQFCTYCIIPFARGRVRSRDARSVLSEVRTLSESGFREIVLTGIHLSSYGVDLPKEQVNTLLGLIMLLHEVDGIERIRLGSLEPRIVTREFVQAIRALPKVCPHFHLSLQSGSDTVLRRMNRRYTSGEYQQGCALLREAYGNPAITTDVIVGFPGETEEEFEETMAFAEKIAFFEMHVFKYSRREGTKAAAMPGQIPETVKAERSDRLLALEESLSKQYRTGFIGQELDILAEETVELSGECYQVGHTREYVRVAVKSERDLTGQIVRVKAAALMSGDETTLLGNLLTEY